MTTWIIIEISSNEFYDYTKQKSQKNSRHRLDCGPKKEPHPGLLHIESACPRASNLCAFLLRVEPDMTEGLRPDHSKLKILKKFPKIKASIPSCDSKSIFFLF